MDGALSEGAFDGPILRPYRQLSSDDLGIDNCIGEESEEDLSNRTSRSTIADRSNRSNRSVIPDFSNHSHRSTIADLSNRSNRSLVPDFVNRSNRSLNADFISRSNKSLNADFSNRSNRSAFRTAADFSNRRRTTIDISDFLNDAPTSPVKEEEDISTSTHQTDTQAASLHGSNSSTLPLPPEHE
jgi:hypothetical protein